MKKFLAVLILAGLLLPAAMAVAKTEAEYQLPTEDFSALVDRVANVIFSVLVIISILFLLYGGVLILTAAGNDEQVTKGRSVLLYAVIGLVIALFAKAIQAFLIKYLI